MASPRDRLIDAAADLFAREGFHAVGIDRILTEAGVARMTLYNHFASKDDLMLAAVRRRDETFRRWLAKQVERAAPPGTERLLAVFDVLAAWIESAEFRGCLFLKACAEYADPDCPLHRAVAEHQRLVMAWLEARAAEAGHPDPGAVARNLYLLMQGAIVIGAAQETGAPARQARIAAARLLGASAA
jgi:AcrR family transcriptional regulator